VKEGRKDTNTEKDRVIQDRRKEQTRKYKHRKKQI
jgi:hypothetical protein